MTRPETDQERIERRRKGLPPPGRKRSSWRPRIEWIRRPTIAEMRRLYSRLFDIPEDLL